MRTWLVEDVSPFAGDHLIVHALDREAYNDEGLPQCLGIRNTRGQIYRHVQVQGMGQRIRAIRLFQKLGFVEEDYGSPTEGCCSTFRPHTAPAAAPGHPTHETATPVRHE